MSPTVRPLVCACVCAHVYVCVNVNDIRNRRMAKWKSCKMSNACVCVCFNFHYCSHHFSLAVCLPCSHFAIIAFINYESGPRWTGWGCRHRRSSRATERPCELLSCWHRLKKHHTFIFLLLVQVATGMSKECRVGWREGAAAGMEICSGICYNYPTLLAMMIILLREWILFAPWPCSLLHFRRWSDELIKTFHRLALWMACDTDVLSSSLFPSGFSIHWLTCSLVK